MLRDVSIHRLPSALSYHPAQNAYLIDHDCCKWFWPTRTFARPSLKKVHASACLQESRRSISWKANTVYTRNAKRGTEGTSAGSVLRIYSSLSPGSFGETELTEPVVSTGGTLERAPDLSWVVGEDVVGGQAAGRRRGGNSKREWLSVQPLWQMAEEEAVSSDEVANLLSPSWRVLLLSDGSVTRHLQLLTGSQVSVECLQMEDIGDSLEGLPPGAALIAGPRLQRQVYLKDAQGQVLAYAASWWPAGEVGRHMKEVGQPIWVNFVQQRAELFRDVQRLYLGHSPALERSFGVAGPFWARHYVFYHKGAPLTFIYEVFSPTLQQYIGPSQQK
eukprot:jgi/Mesen1/7765/ME000408S06875